MQTNIDIKKSIKYTTRGGDSLYKIANKFKVTVSNLIKWNNINIKKPLKIGKRLKLYINIINSK